MPSDHLVKDDAAFAQSLQRAGEVAAKGKLVLFGIVPTGPNTGYGYIRRGAELAGSAGIYAVDAFCEKPDRATAQSYVAGGDYYWNSGIFVLHAATFIAELKQLAPDILAAAREALQGASEDLGFLRLDAEAFARSPSISIDYAVMEKTKKAVMLPIEVGWSDVGSWSSLWETAPQDAQKNAVEGDAILIDTTNCLVHSERSLVATIGLDGLIIVDTPDALLVADQSRAQEVSGLVSRLKQLNRKEHAQHIRSHRPWGYFETLSMGSRFQVKLLHVKPGGQLSLQMHHHRSEHWVVVRGTARVTIGETARLVQENESVYITATNWHRLENPGKVSLEMIEVQIGSYLGEDDIIRSDDVYRRAADEDALDRLLSRREAECHDLAHEPRHRPRIACALNVGAHAAVALRIEQPLRRVGQRSGIDARRHHPRDAVLHLLAKPSDRCRDDGHAGAIGSGGNARLARLDI